MGNKVFEAYCNWKSDEFFSDEIRNELLQLDEQADAEEIEERFCRNLEFGTGGLRAQMGAGTNRLNQYTVGKATQGLALFLLDRFGEEAEKRGVAICYDTRLNSEFFSSIAAKVLSSFGIRVFIQDGPRPTPQLSFAVKHYGCIAGIVITASHNPKEYNGYKVYDEHGCQVVPSQAKEIAAYIEKVDDYKSIDFQGKADLIEVVDSTDAFVAAVQKQHRLSDEEAKKDLSIVYTPLHGTGDIPVRKILTEEGFSSLNVVSEQQVKDGLFSTVVSPNPEEKRALEMGISLARETGADIVLGTDPDCDRVGVAVLHGSDYTLMTGNQIGALIVEYILNNTQLENLKPAIVKTVVTNELGAEIAKKRGVTVFDTLTGFKFIGEKITQFEKAKETGDHLRDYDFVAGYEESFGYLVGTHARDKDAVVSSMLICEIAASLKKQGKTMVDAINELYDEYGYYLDALDSFTFKGEKGKKHINELMKDFRAGSPLSDTVLVEDYLGEIVKDECFGALPKSNVVKYYLSNGCWAAIRPSGTEPKLKIYYGAKGQSLEDAKEKLESMQATLNKIVEKDA